MLGGMNTLEMRQLRDRRLIEGVLANSDVFRGVAATHLAALARQCSTIHARPAEVIAAAGARLPGAFAVAYGTVKLAFRANGGEERVFRLVQAGQTFGEPSALLGRPSPYEARALAESKVVVIPAAAIFAAIERDPRGARQLALTLAERNVSLLAEVEASSMLSSAQRLARYLATLAGTEAEAHLPTSKTVIAARLGMKKETLSRLLRAFAERGVIDMTRRDITILDRERLAELAR